MGNQVFVRNGTYSAKFNETQHMEESKGYANAIIVLGNSHQARI